MTYVDFICKIIRKYKAGKPIYSKSLSAIVQNQYGLTYDKSVSVCSAALKRIVVNQFIPNLRKYQRGIYYLTKSTPFGELVIDINKLIEDKYLTDDSGYESGLSLLHMMGLTTQIPRVRTIVSNKAPRGVCHDTRLNVGIRVPRVVIDHENIKYLQVLDVIDLLDNAPIDADAPYTLIATHINKCELRYDTMYKIAEAYYPKDVLEKITRIKDEGDLVMDIQTTPNNSTANNTEAGLPADKSYLECGLPAYLKASIEKMKAAWSRLDQGEKYSYWDCDYCELQSDINTAEVCGLISEDQAWYLRETYLRMEKRTDIDF